MSSFSGPMSDREMSDPPPLCLEERVVKAINRAADREFVSYLEEAWRCFNTGSHGAAIVWTWCGVMKYLHRVVTNVGTDVFKFRYDKTLEPDSDIGQILDGDFIVTLEKTKLLGLDSNVGLKSWLHNFKKRRDDLAHGNWENPASREEAARYIQEAVERLLGTSFRSHRLRLECVDIRDLAMKYKYDFVSARIVELMDSVMDKERLPNVAHQLLDDCRNDAAKNERTLRNLWHAIFATIESHEQPEIISHAIRLIAESRGIPTNPKSSPTVIVQEPDANDIRPQSFNEDACWRLFRLDIWQIGNLTDHQRRDFYYVILDMLESELRRKETSGSTRYIRFNEGSPILKHALTSFKEKVTNAIACLREDANVSA